jgi:hypothetical protein
VRISPDRAYCHSLELFVHLPTVLETRAERVLAVVAIALVVWVLADIVRNGL